jgi:hypothetical protein
VNIDQEIESETASQKWQLGKVGGRAGFNGDSEHFTSFTSSHSKPVINAIPGGAVSLVELDPNL